MGKWTAQKRIEVLARGRDQWGHGGTHFGNRCEGFPPFSRHHHCDDFCAYPTREECEAAGVPYRAPHEWESRARPSS